MPDRPRILHVTAAVTSGGVERRRLGLVGESSDKFEHHLIASEASGPIHQALLDLGCTVTVYGRAHETRVRHRLSAVHQACQEVVPDIVHGAVIEGYLLASVAGRIARVPTIVVEETSDPGDRSWRGHLLARAAIGLADHAVAVSPAVGRYLSNGLRVPAKKLSVIPNGVPRPALITSEEKADLRAHLGVSASTIIIGSAGRMIDDTHKRFRDLIDAVALLDDENVHLLLAGDGPERSELEEYARQRNDRVRFVGFQMDLGRYYSIMDIFALASEREAFGLVNAEAMRSSLPVVATRVGGIPDVVRHEVTGILVPPRDSREMAGAFRRLIDDPDLRREMGDAGKDRADRLFSSERYVRDVTNLYLQLMAAAHALPNRWGRP